MILGSFEINLKITQFAMVLDLSKKYSFINLKQKYRVMQVYATKNMKKSNS